MRSERRYGLIEAELQDRKRIDLVFAAGQGAAGVISEVVAGAPDRLDVQMRAVLNDDLARVGERLRRDVQRPGRRGRVDRPAVDNSLAGVVTGQVTESIGITGLVDLGVGPEGQGAAGCGLDRSATGIAEIDRPVVEGVVAGED